MRRSGFTDMVGALLNARSVASRPRLPEPIGRPREQTTPVQDPVEGLERAVREAIDILGPIPRERLDGSATALLSRLLSGSRRRQGLFRSVDPGAEGAGFGVGHAPTPWVLGSSNPVTPGRAELLPAAAMLIARSLDRYLAPLSGRQDSRSSARAGVPCDILERSPYVCVSSGLDHTYTTDVALLVDLGGNDTYRNGAGAAPFLPPGSQAYIPVSVNIDLEGDDTYEARPDPEFRMTFGSGSAISGGLGVLVDLAGDDSYSATAPPTPGPPHHSSGVVAQGSGWGGVGLLFDLQGRDSYEAAGRSGSNDGIGVVAQGGAITGPGFVTGDPLGVRVSALPLGGLVDLGVGDDVYTIEAGEGELLPGAQARRAARVAAGQGAADGYLSTGVLFDEGGADRFTASASAVYIGGDAFPPDGSPLAEAQVSAQGLGLNAGALGMLLAGPGPTTYRIRTAGVGTVLVSPEGQGVGFFASAGVLDDQGGDDSYSTRGELSYQRAISVDDSCLTEAGERCASAEASVSGYNSLLADQIFAQGAAVHPGSVGYLRDHAGDDEYLVEADQSLDVTLLDELTRPTAPPSLKVVSYDSPALLAQGFGIVTELSGGAVLRDDAGTDRYTITAHNVTRAQATSAHAPEEPVVRAQSGPREPFIGGQGAGRGGIGALIDQAGIGDRFAASVADPVFTAPNPEGALQHDFSWPRFQGAGPYGLLVARGEAPEIFSSPSRPVCGVSDAGHRGFGSWKECGGFDLGGDPDHEGVDMGVDELGRGEAPGATGGRPSLGFTVDTSDSARAGPVRMDVGAVLLDPGGVPMPQQTIHFNLQCTCKVQEELTARWLNLWMVNGITDENGIARARLPLEGTDDLLSSCGCEFRVLATFDGRAGGLPLFPRHAARSLSLTLE